MELRDRAIDYALRGWAVFPLKPRGKVPLTEHGFKDASSSPHQVKVWWDEFPDANIGIACGASGLLVSDIDGEAGEASIASLPIMVGDPRPPEVATGRGRHLYFSSNGKRYKNRAAILPGVDIRTDGGYVVAPGSIHENGTEYRFIYDGDPPPIPSWLEEILAPFEAGRNTRHIVSRDTNDISTADAIEQGGPIPNTMRNGTLASLGGTMRRRGMTRAEILAALLEVNRNRCNPPLEAHEVGLVAASIAQYSVSETLFNQTDLGNAERMAAQFGSEIRYCHEWGEWLVWNGQYWESDVDGTIWIRAMEVSRQMYEKAPRLEGDAAEKLAKHALKTESVGRLGAMISLCQPLLPIRTKDLDTDLMKLCVENGVIDLETGKMLDHDPGLYQTRMAPVEFDPKAKAPRWDRFLLEIFGGDIELIAYLQRLVGYSITGDIREQAIFILHGRGENGKSVLLETLHKLLGRYASQLAPDAIMAGRRDPGRPTPELAQLPGIRFLAGIETQEYKQLDEALVKQLSGGDPIVARKMRQEYFQFWPQFKLWLATNTLPTISGTDHAIWRRVRRIPFEVRIAESVRDMTLDKKLEAELPGILRWAIAGCLQWQQNGLETPKVVRTATKAYRSSMDVIADFLEERTDEGDFSTPKNELYHAYEDWCHENGEAALSQRELSKKLQERGLEERRIHGGIRCWHGLLVKTVG